MGFEVSFEAWFTIAVLSATLMLLIFSRIPTDTVMFGGVTALLTAGVISPKEALAGLAEPGVVTVGALFIVATGVRETGALRWVTQPILGRPRSVEEAQIRMMLPIAGLSAFMNNTPLVAMMLPVVTEWAKKHRLSASKLLMPLSFATILGGLCSKIGTSTNVLVSSLMNQRLGRPMEMFELTWVGLPVALAGIIYMLITSRWLLPDRRPAISQEDDPRAYTVEMIVEGGSPLIGKTIEEAGLRHLSSMYLIEVERNGHAQTAVGPETRLFAEDRLVFVGIVESVVELQRIQGLKPATNQIFKLDAPRSERCLTEAVVSNSFPLLGQTIRDGRFRTKYNAAVIAVARNGERLRMKIGDIVLMPGDTLLLEAPSSFVEIQRNSRDFFLVSQVEDSRPMRHDKAKLALAVLGLMVAGMSFAIRSEVNVVLIAAGLMLVTGTCSIDAARRSIDWQVLLVIASSMAFGQALQSTGAADRLADALVGLGNGSPRLSLALVYGTTMLFTEALSNNTAAVLMFPLGLATAKALGVNPQPFIMSLTIAASCGFATPIGYQTNLMVYGPGGYRFSDYTRFGGSLNLIVFALTMVLAPLVWPF